MNNESDKYIIFSSVVGILLTISELLPYIKAIKSNGIIEFFIQFCILLFKKNKSVTNEENNQNAQLLGNYSEEPLHEIKSNDNTDENKNKNNSNLVFTSENITITFNSSNQIKIS